MNGKTAKFSLFRQTFKGQRVIREGPSRIIFRLIFDIKVPGGLMHFALDDDPILKSKTSAFFVPSTDEEALERGQPGEDKDYLKPDPKGFWNTTKATPTNVTRLDSGTAIFYSDGDTFKKILINGKKLKGLFVLKRQDKTDMWELKRSAGPGSKIEKKEGKYQYPYPKPD